MQFGSGLRGPLRGWALSLAVHALVLAWLVHAVPAPRYQAEQPDDAPERRSQLVLIPLRPLPAAAPAPAPAPAPKPAPRSGPIGAPTAMEKRAPAAVSSRTVRDEPQPVIALPASARTPPGAAVLEPAPEPAPAAASGPAAVAPGFDMQAARGAVRSALKDRIGEPKTPGRTSPLQATRDEKLGNAIDRGRTPDCQTKYAGGTSLNVILLIPLAIDTLSASGCKWK